MHKSVFEAILTFIFNEFILPTKAPTKSIHIQK